MEPRESQPTEDNQDNKPDSLLPEKPIKDSNKATVLIIIIALVIVGIIISAFVVNHKSTNQKSNNTSEKPEVGGYQTETELRNYKQSAVIQITATGPSPQTLTIPNDTKINWQNTDNKVHVIAIAPGETIPNQFYNNRSIAVGGGYPFVIHKTGAFHYYYTDDPARTGLVIVK